MFNFITGLFELIYIDYKSVETADLMIPQNLQMSDPKYIGRKFKA